MLIFAFLWIKQNMNNRTEIQVLVQSLNVFSVSFYDIHVAVWTLLTSWCCCRGHLGRFPEGQTLLLTVYYTELPLSFQTLVPFLNRIKVKPFPIKYTLFYCFSTQAIYHFPIRFISLLSESEVGEYKVLCTHHVVSVGM